MALDNIRERLALHFDAEASLESRVTRDSYEVHIRMPYRTAEARAGRNGAARGSRDARDNDQATQKRRQPRGHRPLPGTPATRIEPWLNHPCAS